MRILLAFLYLPLLSIAQDPTGIYGRPSIRSEDVKLTGVPETDMDRASDKATEMGVPLFVWVNIDPKQNQALYDQLRGVHIQLPSLFSDTTPRVGAGKSGNYLFIHADKLNANSPNRLMAEWRGELNPTPVTPMKLSNPAPVRYDPPPLGGGGQKPFRSGSYNSTHTCPNCGASQFVISNYNADGTHTHVCNVCGTSWKH
jgi:predicted RNA-binding Zn-ribbon protein involved in translation (DUF1610 family)